MITPRLDVSIKENAFNDAQIVTKTDLDLEQNKNTQTLAATIQNHLGSGVLPLSPEPLILFDSDDLTEVQAELVAASDFDGTGLLPMAQPSDPNLGCQLSLALTESDVWGRFAIRVAIIGLDFNGAMQIDRFYFYRNETQVTSKHYTRILSIFFNDFKGNTICSRFRGGRLIISEAASFQLSRDSIMVSQDNSPDLFWRDFKLAANNITLQTTLQNGVGSEFDAGSLNIDTTGKPSRTLIASDVTSLTGQKFQATTDNIQKITLLMGVRNDGYGFVDSEFNWSGDLVLSIYALQTAVNFNSEIIPELAIDFEPENQPLVQLSVNQGSLKTLGYVLNDVLQPVDFIFNNTRLGSGNSSSLVVGNFYAIVVKRSGASISNTLLLGSGTSTDNTQRLTLFSNSTWVDVTGESLWFQVWTDASKVASGQGYDLGLGMMFSKTSLDLTTGATVDYSARHFSFAEFIKGKELV